MPFNNNINAEIYFFLFSFYYFLLWILFDFLDPGRRYNLSLLGSSSDHDILSTNGPPRDSLLQISGYKIQHSTVQRSLTQPYTVSNHHSSNSPTKPSTLILASSCLPSVHLNSLLALDLLPRALCRLFPSKPVFRLSDEPDDHRLERLHAVLPWNIPGNLRASRCARNNAMEMDMIPLSELYHGLSIRYLTHFYYYAPHSGLSLFNIDLHRPAQSQATTFVISGA
ncbi:hypothetical protein BDW75DRAFT_81481 [Aspergillus navahoensis]